VSLHSLFIAQKSTAPFPFFSIYLRDRTGNKFRSVHGPLLREKSTFSHDNIKPFMEENVKLDIQVFNQ